jgi:hypothetical protein
MMGTKLLVTSEAPNPLRHELQNNIRAMLHGNVWWRKGEALRYHQNAQRDPGARPLTRKFASFASEIGFYRAPLRPHNPARLTANVRRRGDENLHDDLILRSEVLHNIRGHCDFLEGPWGPPPGPPGRTPHGPPRTPPD